MKTYNLTFEKEDNGCWSIVLPKWPFSHKHLMLVAGADDLCEFVSDRQGSENKATVTVTVNRHKYNDREPDIKLSRFMCGHGATYYVKLKDGTIPKLDKEQIDTVWICPVTLFVLGKYPKTINIYTN